ncbi:ABC transporter substrate-binding protein [Pseudemcibacter aquimaris]|uniref:ABC transporter substrate-binding protein n=1 Tax=Pseudemcibacter aquimaris TaxID=2857064 RepID=UPI002011A478|nr:ABC transporter substrate-binding protein [Pseudemcibacter aquimaris]MCC3859710.1 ABC transporter substrate-binding protein [Pseudemcibacter aquimaris]WDU60105.1 ABC transporter substrate-binding protein [Pseudemcibacter aquimaris]
MMRYAFTFIIYLCLLFSVSAKPILNAGLQLEPPNLDPTSGAAAAIDEVVYGNIFEGLVRIDQNGDVVPGLATSWNVSRDGRSYLFTLAKGVMFHDGTTFDAEDVRFSFNRGRAENSTNAKKYIFEPIANIDVFDANTVMITLKRPKPDFLFNIGLGDAVIVAEESVSGNAYNPIGTGPFKFDKWVRGDRITLTRNDEYWGIAAKLEQVTFKIITDPLSAYTAMMAGDIDTFPNYPAPENLFLFNDDPDYEVVVGLTAGETILSTNNKKTPFDNILVRRAMAHAINRKELIDGAMFGNAEPIGSHFAPTHPDYIDLTGLYPHDLEKARSLMSEAGFADGFEASLKLPPPIYARRTGELIAHQLSKIGIRLQIENMEWAQWIDQVLRHKNYDLTIVSHVEPMDINIYANPNYYFGYDDEDFQFLMGLIDRSEDPTEISNFYKIAQHKIAEDAVNGYLYQMGKYGVWKKGLKGMWRDYPIRSNDFRDVYFEGDTE